MASEPVPIDPKIGSRNPERRLVTVHPTSRAAAKGVKPGRSVDPLNPYTLTINRLQKRPAGREPRTLAALKVIRDLDPTAAQAIWNFLRLSGEGFDMKAMSVDANGQEQEERGAAQAYLDELMRRVGAEYGGGGDQFHGVLTLSLLTAGALAMEVVPTATLDGVEDWYAIDPTLLSFQREKGTGRLVLGWYPYEKPGEFEALNPNQVFYDPLDPDVDDPYGRPPMLSAVGAVMAKAQLINDLRAVVHNQGYPRLDLEVNTEYVLNAAPSTLKEPGRQDELTEWIDQQVAAIVSNFEALNVDDTFVHLDFVKVNSIAVGGGMDFEKVEGILTRSLNSALKTLPIMVGFNEAATESHGSVQWQIQVSGIMALRRRVKRAMERAANISLQLAGIAGHAKCVYEEIRVVDRLYEKQADLFEAKTQAFAVSQNWITNDEAANSIYGHDSLGEPKLIADSTSTIPGEGPQAPQGQDQGKTQQKQEPGWDLLWRSESSEAAAGQRGRPSAVPATSTPRAYSDAKADAYAKEGGRIFLALVDEVVANLQAEGKLRDVPKDIADDVFGRAFAREMKRLMRDAMEEGILDAEVDFAVAVNETVIDRIWNQNRFYVAKLREELKSAMRGGELRTVADVHAWFQRNAWREELMGRFIAKQSYSAGFAMAKQMEGTRRFTWILGAPERHCGTCLARGGGEFTFDELQSIGMPGSGSLECGGNCHCSLEPVYEEGRSADAVDLMAGLLHARDEQMGRLIERLSEPQPVETRDDDRLIAALEAVGNRPVEVHTTIEPGAVQVTVAAPEKAEPKLLTREAEFVTDERGVIVGKKETETWQ